MLPDEQECLSTTNQLCFQESPKKPDQDHGVVQYVDQNSIILLHVKESQEADESGNLMRKSASSDHNHQPPADKIFVELPFNNQFSNGQKRRERISCLGEGAEENNDGFQTPTKFMAYESSTSGFKCPPAPRKRKAEPLAPERRRVCIRRNLQVEFVADVELGLRFLGSSGDPKLKKAAYTLATNESSHLGTCKLSERIS